MTSTRFEDLVELFRRAGAPNPEAWATSEVEEDIPQLARYLFLRQAWKCVISEDDTSWIQACIEMAADDPNAPGAGGGSALRRLIDAGADPSDLTQVARLMQWQLLFRMCYLLEDPCIEEPELRDISWLLVEVHPDETFGRAITGLHESVLETDPTGREMRPEST